MDPIKRKTIIKLITHSLFWVVYIVVLFVFDSQYSGDESIKWYEKIEINVLILVGGITYLNEGWLLPFFLKRKSYVVYSAIILGLLFSATLFYCYFITECDSTVSACFSDNLWKISLPLVFLSFISVVIQFLDKQKELEKAHKDRLEFELKFLKSQINPHVLFNSLNTIYAQALKESDKIAEMILMLSENLKYVLNQSKDTFVDLEKDIIFIENYLEFQKLRIQGINNIIYKKDIDSYNHSIPPLIMIDLIENAFKHSKFKDDGLSDIDIYLSIKKGKLHFICKNEMETLPVQEKRKSTQIGLKNLDQRLQLIYKENYQLVMNTDKGIFCVDLKINLG